VSCSATVVRVLLKQEDELLEVVSTC
jgi:hypothetical protein